MHTKTRSVPIYDSSALRIPLIYEFQGLIAYRFLVWNLIVRDLKVRYKRSSIGFIWVMLNPLLTMAVLTFVFSQVFRYNVNHYPVYLLSGTLLWNLYAQGSTAAMANLQGNGSVLRKLYVPPSVFVASSTGSAVVNFIFALGPFLFLALLTDLPPSISWFSLIIPATLTMLFTMGMGLIVGAFVVFFNDTYEIYQVLLNAYYFLTPVFYPVSILPEPLRSIEQYNPMYLFLESFRVAIIQQTFPSLNEIVPALAMACGTFLIGWIVFTRLEGKFVYQF
jgi:ABC-type polysaccharide/polyol phosphate export permease